MSINMKRLAVIPNDPIEAYIKGGYSKSFLQSYFNPDRYFDEVYLLSPRENDNPDVLGMRSMRVSKWQLHKKIKELDIDLVRVYNGSWACKLASVNKVEGVPLVASVHDGHIKYLSNTIAGADVVLCVSEHQRNIVLQKYPDASRVWVLPNRVNFGVMRPVQNAGDELDKSYPHKYRILAVGRLTEQKNYETLIKALKLLGDDYCLLAVGRGEREQELKALARQLGVTDRCYFIDSIHNEELLKYYSWADCMCTPSLWEGFGIVFIEALACESVVVTSDIAPMNEYIRHGENGLLVKEYRDPAALADMIKKACTDADLRQRLKNNARRSVEPFEKKRVDALEAGYYDKVLAMEKAGQFTGKTTGINRFFNNLLSPVIK